MRWKREGSYDGYAAWGLLGSKYSHFIVFKVRESKIEIRRQENKTFRHEFSRGMWKDGIALAQQKYAIQVYANDKGKQTSLLCN